MTDTTEDRAGPLSDRIDKPLFAVTGGFIALFCAYAMIDLDGLSALVDGAFAVSARYFGLYWQVLLLATFLIGLVLCVLPGGRAVMGGLDRPEFGLFSWGSMIMCTLLAGGGVFWAAGEPIAHFLAVPPVFGELDGDPQARAEAALAQSFLHWGFLAWAILGALTTVMLMHYHYDRGLPLAPRTLLYPVFGDRALHGPIGLIADACCIVAVVAGTVGPIGFLGLQMSYGLNALTGVPDTFATQAVAVLALVGVYTISAVTGLAKGIQLLSRLNVVLALALLAFMLVAGPTAAIFGGFLGGMRVYLANFFQMALHRGDAGVFGDPGWLGWWTVFFWGWFMGYGPLMAIFIARISRGRSIRVDYRDADLDRADHHQLLVHDHRRVRHLLRDRPARDRLRSVRGVQPPRRPPGDHPGDAVGPAPVDPVPGADHVLRRHDQRLDELRHLVLDVRGRARGRGCAPSGASPWA